MFVPQLRGWGGVAFPPVTPLLRRIHVMVIWSLGTIPSSASKSRHPTKYRGKYANFFENTFKYGMQNNFLLELGRCYKSSYNVQFEVKNKTKKAKRCKIKPPTKHKNKISKIADYD